MSVQTVSAAQAVGEYLKSPDDLMKIASFRKKLEKEKASIDARLKVGVKEQLDATRDGLRKLLGTRANVQAIKDEMTTVDTQCRNPQNVISTFDQISRVSMVHRNFQQVEEMVNNLTEMYSKLDVLEEMLDADGQNIVGPAPNLLSVHFHLNQLEAFRSETVHQAKKASAESRATLARYFERLIKFTEDFEDYYDVLCHNILPLVRARNPGVVVKLVKIAEIEGKEDEKAIAIKLVKKAAKMDAASKFRSMQANARVIKNYRFKMIKAIGESVAASFEAAVEHGDGDAEAFLQNLDWMYDDLVLVESEVVACFPEDFKIYAIVVKEYHKALNKTLETLLEAKPGAGFMLALHDWIKEYKKNMKKLEIPPEWLEPPLLDGKEQALLDDFVNVIIQKLDEWTRNLLDGEVTQFVSRTEPPEQDNDRLYVMQGSVTFFQMANQQVDVAMESGQGAILTRVVSEVNRVMRLMQDQWMKLLDSEFAKKADKPEEAADGLGEYCIALANDQMKSADFTEALSAKLESRVASEKHKTVIIERLNDGIDGYLDVAKKCTQTLIRIIFNDLKPATKQLFSTAWHEDQSQSAGLQIVETMRDYMDDWQQYLNPSILDLLVEDLIDDFLVTYLTALANASKLRMPIAIDRIRDDIGAAFEFFSSVKPPKELEAYFDVMDSVLALLEASKSLVFLSFWEFAKVHGPNLTFVEGLMKARDDLDRTSVTEVMESIKRKIKDEAITDPPEPTIMKKIAVQSTFARFLRTGQ